MLHINHYIFALILLVLSFSNCGSDIANNSNPATGSNTGPATYSWKEILEYKEETERNKETQWAARYGHQVVVKGSDFYLFGGRDRNNYYNDVWKLTDDGASWKKILKYKTEPARNKETQWAVRYGHQVVVKGDDSIFLVVEIGITTIMTYGSRLMMEQAGKRY